MQVQTIDTTCGRIACRQSKGSGPAIVILHGNSASSNAFAPQIESALGDKYRILVPDLPGHGGSDDATDPAGTYNLPGYAAVLHEVVARLDATDAVFVGWSLGGHIVLEAAPDLAKARGFAIVGTPPISFPPAMDQAFLPTPAMAYTFQPELNEEQARAYVAAAFRPGVTDLPAQMVTDVLRTDGRARGQLAASIRPGGFRDEVAVAADLKQPLAVLHGAEEQLVNGAYFDTLTMPTLWRGKVQVIDGAGHLPQWEQAELFNALLDQFVTDVAT
ncbi:alpha/beta fold hydrolase [Rhodopseudomonas sp. NSM]|uniref:alpha/beta fold hydrolase n=1 Tax=Rhodopseudomonas sp. NSM TaxID=3457630 RepID=UPI00403565FA